MRLTFAAAFLPIALAACATPEPIALVGPTPPPARDRLHTPASVTDGKLQYTPEWKEFAPIMTHRRPYPTQEQAQFAFERSQWTTVRDTIIRKSGPSGMTQVYEPTTDAAAVRIFACKPGALHGGIGRTIPVRQNVVVCATDLLDNAGEAVARVPLNFYYQGGAWRVNDPEPGYVPPRWAGR